MQRLVKDRFVHPAGDETFCKLNGWMPLHKRLLAVELKLTRIDDALHQAINNLGFADESYVVLPTDVAKRLTKSKRMPDFDERGIGILAVTPDGCRRVLPPRKQKPSTTNTTQAYSVERFWLEGLNGQRVPVPIQ